ncbi:MAG TPA: SHOCT domain-containing protein [Miltoncostaeaceae bacterium]|nr:SHOCT domain-containing protein [Miltoncostaeaceae bacterium]
MTTLIDIASMAAAADGDHAGGWWIPFVLLWAAVIAAVTWLVIRAVRNRGKKGMDRARDILAERYARGEISGEEYRERRDELG